MNKRLRVIITILLILVIAGIIFYPKIKPLFASKPKGPGGSGTGAMQSRQVLNVSGFLIKPVKMSELINSNGTLGPDEEVELSFETSGKIVGINFTAI